MNTRDRIIESGLKLFLEKGYDATSVSMIMKDVGISKSTFFHYFNTKQDLVNEIYLKCKQDFTYYQKDDYTIFSFLEENYNFSIEHKDELQFMSYFENSPYIYKETIQQGISFHQGMIDEIEKLQKENKITSIPAHMLCRILADLMLESIDYVVVDGKVNEENLNIVKKLFNNMLIP